MKVKRTLPSSGNIYVTPPVLIRDGEEDFQDLLYALKTQESSSDADSVGSDKISEISSKVDRYEMRRISIADTHLWLNYKDTWFLLNPWKEQKLHLFYNAFSPNKTEPVILYLIIMIIIYLICMYIFILLFISWKYLCLCSIMSMYVFIIVCQWVFLVHVQMFIISFFHYLQNNNFITLFHVFQNVKIFKVHVHFIKENYIVCMIVSTF